MPPVSIITWYFESKRERTKLPWTSFTKSSILDLWQGSDTTVRIKESFSSKQPSSKKITKTTKKNHLAKGYFYSDITCVSPQLIKRRTSSTWKNRTQITLFSQMFNQGSDVIRHLTHNMPPVFFNNLWKGDKEGGRG